VIKNTHMFADMLHHAVTLILKNHWPS